MSTVGRAANAAMTSTSRDVRGQASEASPEKLAETARDGQTLFGQTPGPESSELTSELDGEERVPGSGLVDSQEVRAGEVESYTTSEQVVECTDTERADRQPSQPPSRQTAFKFDRSGHRR